MISLVSFTVLQGLWSPIPSRVLSFPSECWRGNAAFLDHRWLAGTMIKEVREKLARLKFSEEESKKILT